MQWRAGVLAVLAWWLVWSSDPPAPTRILVGPFDAQEVCIASGLETGAGSRGAWAFEGCKELTVEGDYRCRAG